MHEGTKMSNGKPACSIDAVDARWLFPQERAPSCPPRKTQVDDCDALLASTLETYFETKINANFTKVEATVDIFFAKLDARLVEHFATLEAL